MSESIRVYAPIQDIRVVQVSMGYPLAFYELLRPDIARRGHVIQNSGQVPIVVYFGVDLDSLHPPSPVSFVVNLYPGDFYLGDVPELIPLAAKWLDESDIFRSDSFDLAELTIRELL